MRIRSLLAFVGICAGIALTSPAKSADPAPATTNAAEPRIISVGGDVTEILYALGMAGAIVAIDATSTFPPDAMKTKKNVGYMRALSTEGVLSTGGTSVIASDRAGPPEVIAALKTSAIAYHAVEENNSPDGVTAKIRAIGGIVGKATEADALVGEITQKFAKLQTLHVSLPAKKRRVLFVLATQNGRATIGGHNTSADSIISLAGAENAAKAIEGFKPVTDEQLVELAPDVVLVMKRSSGPSTLEEVKKLQGLQTTAAMANNQIIEVDGSFVIGFGPRAPEAARYVMLTVYPEIKDLAQQGQTQ